MGVNNTNVTDTKDIDDSVEIKIKQLIADQLNTDIKKVVNEAYFVADLGADSLDTVELIMSLEESFGVEIPDEEAENIQTVQDAIDYIKVRI